MTGSTLETPRASAPKRFALLTALVLMLAGVFAPAAAWAVQEQAPSAEPAAAAAAADTAGAEMAAALESASDRDGAASIGVGASLMFWLFALLTVGGSIFVITRRNLISAVMGMVGTFFAIAAVYTMLFAHFLAAIQVLVYAGAIMVLFVFVIMILNKPEDEPWGRSGIIGNVLGSALVAYLLWRIGAVLWAVPVSPAQLLPPGGVTVVTGVTETVHDYGSTMAIGQNLFRDYLFPFEAVSLVLLIAVVGALAVARPHEAPPPAMEAEQTTNA